MNHNFYKRLIAISVPITLQQLIVSSLNMVDTFMISSLSEASIAGVGAANKVFFLLNLFLFGMSSGSSILTAQFWGKKDLVNIKRVYGLSLTFALLGAALFTVAAVLFPYQVMRIFTPDQGVIYEGASYLRIVGISYMITAVSFSTMFVLRSTNYVRLPLLITIIAIGVNTFLNYTLIYGHFNAPAMGVRGAAIATLIARTLECVLMLVAVNVMHLPPAGRLKTIFSYHKDMTSRFIKIATPVVINEVLWSTGVAMYSIVYGRMNRDAMATMAITQTIEQIAFVFSVGVGNSCAIILGNSLGAKEGESVYEDAKRFVRINFVLGAVIGLMVMFLAPSIASIYNQSAGVYYNIIGTLNVFGLYLMFKSVNLVVIVGILRSGGDTTFSALLDGLGVWGIGVPLAFLTGLVFKWDLPFVYAAILFEEFVKLGFGLKRLVSRKWMNNLVEADKT